MWQVWSNFKKKVNFVECNQDSNNDMDDLADQVQSLFYH